MLLDLVNIWEAAVSWLINVLMKGFKVRMWMRSISLELFHTLLMDTEKLSLIEQCPDYFSRRDHTSRFLRLELQSTGESPYSM